jgi:pimeloyl-ACP methyl ester carboxylesterase
LYGDERKPPLLLLHGFMDHAHAWDFTAEALVDDYFCVALDFRGFGDSAWDPSGAYAFPLYQLDVTALVDALGLTQTAVAGHSMGGNVAAQWAGVFPERVSKLILVEGFGPPEREPDEFPARMARWVRGILGAEASHPRVFAKPEDAAARLQETHARLTDERALYLARHAVRKKDDGYVWKFDPAHRLPNPHPYLFEEYAHYLRRIQASVLAIHGSEGPVSIEAMGNRYAHIPHLGTHVIENAGHAVHIEQPLRLAETMRSFLKDG